ncbi:MAG TPA: MFS transporter [Gemmatimonadaceae bacterium]|nr:MFS transporter [Gemmatimonadaceae bacterium]
MSGNPQVLEPTDVHGPAEQLAEDLRAVAERKPASLLTVALRPRFALLVAGQTVSQFGDKLQAMALIALVGARAQVGTSGLELAKLAVVFTLPMIVLGPIAGAFVDRWNKVRTLIVCDAFRAVLVGLMPGAYALTHGLWTVYVLAGLSYLLGVFHQSAKLALIPELVERHELLPANASLALIGRFATVFGIVGGGLILSATVWQRFGWPSYAAGFYIDAASFAFSALTMLIIGIPMLRERRLHPPAVSLTSLHPLRALHAAYVIIKRDAQLRFTFATVAFFAVVAAAGYVILVVSVQTVLGQGTTGVGYLGGITAVGMIIGSLAIGTIGTRADKRTVILGSFVLLGLAMFAGSLVYAFVTLLPIALIGGALLAPIMVSQDTLLHESAPRDSRAIVFSTRELVLGSVFVTTCWAVGGAVALADRAGWDAPYRTMLGICGILFALVGGIAALAHARGRRRPHVRPS